MLYTVLNASRKGNIIFSYLLLSRNKPFGGLLGLGLLSGARFLSGQSLLDVLHD